MQVKDWGQAQAGHVRSEVIPYIFPKIQRCVQGDPDPTPLLLTRDRTSCPKRKQNLMNMLNTFQSETILSRLKYMLSQTKITDVKHLAVRSF